MIQVVCTGKGSHRAVEMRRFSFQATRRFSWEKDDDWLEIADHAAAPLKDSYTFTCRRCGHETRMTAKTLRKALDGIQAADPASLASRSYVNDYIPPYPPLDISRLPF